MKRNFCAVAVMAVTFVSALLVGGCSDDGGDGGGGDIGTHGSRFLGDWAYNRSKDMNNLREFMSFNSNGDYFRSDLYKVDDFWIEDSRRMGTWRADDRYLYWWRVTSTSERKSEYIISGNTLTLIDCDDEPGYENDCWETVFTRGDGRPSGTVYSNDPALRDTYWRMGNSYLELDGVGFYSSKGYFDGGVGTYAAYYTSGNRLYLLDYKRVENSCRTIIEEYSCGGGQVCVDTWEGDCAYTVVEQVEFTYTHVPLTSLRLRNNNFDDTWEYYNYYDNDYYYKRRNASENGKRQNPFRRSGWGADFMF